LNLTHVHGVSEDGLEEMPVLMATCGYDKNVHVSQIIRQSGDQEEEEEQEGSGEEEIKNEHIISFSGHNWSVTGVDFCPLAFPFSNEPEKSLDILIASLDQEGDVFVWNAWSGEKLLSIKLPGAGRSSDVSSNPLRFRPMQKDAQEKLFIVTSFGKALHCILIQVSGRDSSSAEDSEELKLSPKIVSVQTRHEKNISSLDWSQDGKWLLSSSEDKVCLWDTSTLLGSPSSKDPFRLVTSIPAQTGKISSCTFLEFFENTLPSSPLPSSSSQQQQQQKDLPPRVLVGEYQSMHIWEVRNPNLSSGKPTKVSSFLSCQDGVVTCLDALVVPNSVSAESTGPFSWMLVSASGSAENNLKLWRL
jgi:WD40 repeat protein